MTKIRSINKGSDNGRAKLNESDVRAIRERLKTGQKHIDIAEIFNVSKETISSISSNRNWKHVVDIPL